MLQLILGILLCSAALTLRTVRQETVINKANSTHDRFWKMNAIVNFINTIVLVSAIVWLIDMLLNTQVTL